MFWSNCRPDIQTRADRDRDYRLLNASKPHGLSASLTGRTINCARKYRYTDARHALLHLTHCRRERECLSLASACRLVPEIEKSYTRLLCRSVRYPTLTN